MSIWNRTVRAGAAPLFALALAAGARAGVTGYVTLQVRSEPNGYGAVDVFSFLQDGAFLGSTCQGAIPSQEFGLDEIPAGAVVVTANHAGGEILSLRVEGRDEATVSAAIEQITGALARIVPPGRAQAREALQQAEQQAASARQAFLEAREAERGFVAQHGAVEPQVWLGQLQKTLMDRTEYQERVELELAEARALRDYVAKALELEPARLEQVRPAANERLTVLREQLIMLQIDLKQLLDSHPEGHPQVAAARGEIEKLEQMLRARESETTVAENPRRAELAHELFNVERDLVLSEHRHRQLSDSVARLQAEATRYALLNATWQEMNRSRGRSESELREADKQLAEARQRASRVLVGNWIEVVAGPVVFAAKDV